MVIQPIMMSFIYIIEGVDVRVFVFTVNHTSTIEEYSFDPTEELIETIPTFSLPRPRSLIHLIRHISHEPNIPQITQRPNGSPLKDLIRNKDDEEENRLHASSQRF